MRRWAIWSAGSASQAAPPFQSGLKPVAVAAFNQARTNRQAQGQGPRRVQTVQPIRQIAMAVAHRRVRLGNHMVLAHGGQLAKRVSVFGLQLRACAVGVVQRGRPDRADAQRAARSKKRSQPKSLSTRWGRAPVCWRAAPARCGFGAWPTTAGVRPNSGWTSIMPSNTAWPWAGRCGARTRGNSKPGSNRWCANSEMNRR